MAPDRTPIGQGANARASVRRLVVDFGTVAAASPDQVGIAADERVAPADGTALDRFQQEAVGAALGELQHRRDGRVQVGHQHRPENLRASVVVGTDELRKIGSNVHRTCRADQSCSSARGLTLTEYRPRNAAENWLSTSLRRDSASSVRMPPSEADATFRSRRQDRRQAGDQEAALDRHDHHLARLGSKHRLRPWRAARRSLPRRSARTVASSWPSR